MHWSYHSFVLSHTYITSPFSASPIRHTMVPNDIINGLVQERRNSIANRQRTGVTSFLG